MVKNQRPISGAKILVLGITFKENCPDIRNTRVIDIIHELRSYDTQVEIYDPWANKQEVQHEYSIDLIDDPQGPYDAIILAVSHKEFLSLDLDTLKAENGLVYDVKGFLPNEVVDARL